jgi:hypothetical protein
MARVEPSPYFPAFPLGGFGEKSAETPLLWEQKPPQLVRPSSEYRLISLANELELSIGEILNSVTMRLGDVKEKIRSLSVENIQKLKQAALKAQSGDFWSMLKKIASCLLGTISMVFGASCIASGGGALIGGVMIASGLLSLATITLSECKAWDWIAGQLSHENEERKNQLALLLPLSLGILAAGCGIAGSVHGIASGAILAVQKTALIAQTSLSLFSGVTTMGKGITEAQGVWIQADLQCIQGHLTEEREELNSLTEKIRTFLSELKGALKKAQNALDVINKTKTQLIR